MSDGAPTGCNIEGFPFERFVGIMRQFAEMHASNILTVMNAGTFSNAGGSPEQYNLLRVRTVGWPDFVTPVFPVRQGQYRRRPVSAPEPVKQRFGRARFAKHR